MARRTDPEDHLGGEHNRKPEGTTSAKKSRARRYRRFWRKLLQGRLPIR